MWTHHPTFPMPFHTSVNAFNKWWGVDAVLMRRGNVFVGTVRGIFSNKKDIVAGRSETDLTAKPSDDLEGAIHALKVHALTLIGEHWTRSRFNRRRPSYLADTPAIPLPALDPSGGQLWGAAAIASALKVSVRYVYTLREKHAAPIVNAGGTLFTTVEWMNRYFDSLLPDEDDVQSSFLQGRPRRPKFSHTPKRQKTGDEHRPPPT